MRKIFLVLAVLFVLATAASTATAQDQITLGATAANSMTFTGAGSGNWTLAFTPDPLSGTAFGTGSLSSGPAPYSITQGSVTINGTEVDSTHWNISQSGSLSFLYGTVGLPLLTGNLQLVSLVQSGQIGTFNDSLAANLAITGGSLATALTTNAILSITIDFTSATSLATLGHGSTLGARISSGELFPAPEPVSMVLVGSGLILLGGLVRLRRTHPVTRT